MSTENAPGVLALHLAQLVVSGEISPRRAASIAATYQMEQQEPFDVFSPLWRFCVLDAEYLTMNAYPKIQEGLDDMDSAVTEYCQGLLGNKEG
jgi:hypothetical protein